MCNSFPTTDRLMCRYLPHTSRVVFFFFFLAADSLFGVVGASTEALCLAWVLCSSTSVGAQILQTLLTFLVWGASRPSCAVIVTEDSSVIALVRQKEKQLGSSASCGSVGGFHLRRHNSRHVFVLCTAPDFRKKTSEKSLFRCSNLPASPLLTFCFKLFWQSTETRSIKVSLISFHEFSGSSSCLVKIQYFFSFSDTVAQQRCLSIPCSLLSWSQADPLLLWLFTCGVIDHVWPHFCFVRHSSARQAIIYTAQPWQTSALRLLGILGFDFLGKNDEWSGATLHRNYENTKQEPVLTLQS